MGEISKYGPLAIGAVALGQVVKEIYSDTASPGMKKLGEALSSIVDFGLGTITYPINLINEKRKIRFAINMHRFKEKLEIIPDENIVNVDPEIAQPILERLAFSLNEELSEAFINLLVAASNTKSATIAHPAFIYIIDRLCPDEAKILKYFSAFKGIGYILPSLKYKLRNETKEDNIFKYEIRTFKRLWFTEIDIKNDIFLFNKQNVSLYLDNLLSLGLITPQIGDLSINKSSILINKYKEIFPTKYRLISIPEREYYLEFEEGYLRITSFGELFLKACSIKQSSLPENYDDVVG